MPQQLTHALLVASGGALGALSRYGVAIALRRAQEHFPWATLLVNVLGCLIAGALVGAFGADRERLSDEARLLLMVGFLGGRTTFSTFGTDTLILWRRAPGPALLNVGLNLTLSLLAVGLGARLGAWSAALPAGPR